jgi:HK97 family phage major capsid protein
MVQDGVSFESQLEIALIKGLGYGLDNAFINGTGAGQPLGIISCDSKVSVAKETGQAADTVVYENLVKMEARLHPSCVLNAVWLANPSVQPDLRTLALAVGTGGTAVPALKRVENEYYLLDRPLYFTEKCPTAGDVGDIILADLTKYAIGLRQELQVDKSNTPGWLTDTLDYRVIVRVDGMPVWNKAFTPKAGPTLSWAVVLDAR